MIDWGYFALFSSFVWVCGCLCVCVCIAFVVLIHSANGAEL